MRVLLLSLLFLFSTTAMSQLPKEWMGHYKGDLTSYNLKGDKSQFGMELILSEKKDSTYNFTIIYHVKDTTQERAYILIPDGKNKFKLDELNGIIVDINLLHNRLVSFFEVQKNFIHVSYIFGNDLLKFELTSSTLGAITGGVSNNEEEEIPLVQSFKTVAYQVAILKRVTE